MTGQSHEIIHCPNCKEDVPKTLYCLNCGYPLYKLEKQKTEDALGEVHEHEVQAGEVVDMSVEIEPLEPVSLIEETPSEAMEETITDIEAETQIIEEGPIPDIDEVEPEVETSIIEEVPISEIEEIEPEIETQIYVEEEPMPDLELEEETVLEMEPDIVAPIYVEEEPAPDLELEEETVLETEPDIMAPIYVEDEIPTHAELEEPETAQPSVWDAQIEYEEPVQDVIEPESDFYIPERRDPYPMNEIQIEFTPDPLTKEVIESLAKNITLKIRLVRLLRENQVKEETFEKLFDSYVEQGKLWVSRRDETLGRLDTDIDRMEDELVSARKDFELLEIRKNIGDASDQEYSVKAPAFKWDIENLDNEIKNTRGGIQYVNNLRGLIPEEEITELKSMADNNFSELEEIDGVSSETIARIKETLSDALNSLEK